MVPEMRRALQERYPGKKVRAWDEMLVTRDPWAKQVCIMINGEGNLHTYHVPTWELMPLAWALVKAFGVAGCAEWIALKLHLIKPRVEAK